MKTQDEIEGRAMMFGAALVMAIVLVVLRSLLGQ